MIIKPLVGLLLGAVLLTGCTLGDLADARTTLKNVGTAGKSYVNDQIETRKEYRTGIRATIRAEYEALMGAARDAERNGNMKVARENWTAARTLYTENMPQLKKIKDKIGDFFHDD